MRKKFIFISILVLLLLVISYIFGYKKVMNESDNKQIEQSITFDLNSLVDNIQNSDNYLLTAKYYELKTEVNNNKIIISFSNQEHQGKLIGNLNKSILSFKIKNSDENALLKANLIYAIVDSLGQLNGNEKGYVSAMLSDYDLEGATLTEDGFELISKDDTNIYKFMINKRFELGNIENSYYKETDLMDVKNKFLSDEYIQETKGNIVFYKETDFYKNNNIYICEPVNLTKRSYNSLINTIGLIYGADYKKQFSSSYPELVSGNVLDKFAIVIDYQPSDNEFIKKLITDNYKILKVTYKN